jgi:hypothetical protein
MVHFLLDEFEHIIMWNLAIWEETVDGVLFIGIRGKRGVKIEGFAGCVISSGIQQYQPPTSFVELPREVSEQAYRGWINGGNLVQIRYHVLLASLEQRLQVLSKDGVIGSQA